MEMNDEYIPELHVAQQRRRDKLRLQQMEYLHNNDFHNNDSNMLFSTEMLSFSGSQSNGYSNIHPSRFVAPSSSDSYDPVSDNWVSRNYLLTLQNNNNNNNNNNGYYQNNNNYLINELPLLPSFVTQANTDNNASVLSLSLSSNQIHEMNQLNEPRELKPFEMGGVLGSSNHSHVYRNVNVGPLGPFTGYATILKGSKFLKPAQLMLDEFLSVAGLRNVGRCDEVAESVSSFNNGFGSRVSSGSGSVSGECYRLDCDEKKAKLMYMQEEVCKRHKQYHEQMEMVMTAFESIPGLANATPYISRSLKIISRHFKTIKSAISDQIKFIKRSLGEDQLTPTNYTKNHNSSSRVNNRSFEKVKGGGVVGGSVYGGGIQNHMWRPQRGLPERAVSVLRAWLFDHFLHPYPTDSDKQMLASQTGLSRNQVSNWFINARVRLWKPMVEEIHMLETKGGTGHSSEPNVLNNHKQSATTKSVNASTIPDSYMGGSNPDPQIQTGMDSSFVGLLPYQRRGIGDVSLTLGLRHGSEQQFHHQGMHLGGGGYVLHDFTR